MEPEEAVLDYINILGISVSLCATFGLSYSAWEEIRPEIQWDSECQGTNVHLSDNGRKSVSEIKC